MGIIPNRLEPPGLRHARADVNGIWLHYVSGGDNSAEPLVLLHGFPESWLMWRQVLPALLERHRVIAVDLRGYGDSANPPPEAGYDKGTMAADIHALIQQLGLSRPVLIGHDRGARVARRYGLNWPDEVRGLALLDILPLEYIYDRLTATEVAERYWHWIFQVVPELPERLIAGREECYLEQFFNRTPGLLHELRTNGVWLEYLRAFRQPGALEGALADYRAAYTIDRPRYQADRAAGQRLTVPTLLLWGDRGNLANWPVLDIWGEVATDLRGRPIADCGHYLPEEQPAIVADLLLHFATACFAAGERHGCRAEEAG